MHITILKKCLKVILPELKLEEDSNGEIIVYTGLQFTDETKERVEDIKLPQVEDLKDINFTGEQDHASYIEDQRGEE